MNTQTSADPRYPLYDPRWEHDACGTGFVAHISGAATHQLVLTALEALAHLTHRGAQDADAATGDGAGILTQLPRALLQAELAAQGIAIAHPDDLAVGMIFLPSLERAPQAHNASQQIIESVCRAVGVPILTWRAPPIDVTALGTRAQDSAPTIAQIVLLRPSNLTPQQFEHTLYRARRLIEQRLHAGADSSLPSCEDCYIASLSSMTIVYKGLLSASDLPCFYRDLADPRYASAFAIFHQRYSTNTFPSWPLAQPMRLLAHNGEINTIQGNRQWMQAREGALFSAQWDRPPQGGPLHVAAPLVGVDPMGVGPVIDARGSDSGQLDNALELLQESGRDLLHSMQMLVPPAWEEDAALPPAQRAWCEYHAGIIEPWDGPAALVFSDGRIVGAALDRNGLRPARYLLTSQGMLVLASEAGVVDSEAHEVVEKGRLGPGEMLAVDLARGVLLRNAEIKAALATRQPYQQWIDNYLLHLSDLSLVGATVGGATPTRGAATCSGPPCGGRTSDGCGDRHCGQEVLPIPDAALFDQQHLFGYTHEDIEFVLRPMLKDQKEPLWSMGDDAPLAALSCQSRSLADHFHQRFAQVTNPPIDPLRERCMMSLDVYLGRRQNLLSETALHAQLLHLDSPLLTSAQADIMRSLKASGFVLRTLDATFTAAGGSAANLPGGQVIEAALDRLERDAISAIADGTTLLILSDRAANAEQAPLPMLLATGAVHQCLVRHGLRTYASLLCETGAAWDIHQVALLLGYGAEAVMPWLAIESVQALAGERHLEHLTPPQAEAAYIHALEEGLRKVMARMGISTIRNIIGAGQFEIMGLRPEIVERCFAGSAAHPGTISYAALAEPIVQRCTKLAQAVGEPNAADTSRRRKHFDMGRYRFRRDAEYHAFNPTLVRALQQAARSGDVEDYRRFTALVYQRPPTTLRDLLSFKHVGRPPQGGPLHVAAPLVGVVAPIPLDLVEPMEAIRARFVVSAMSIGALSPETHRTIAAAMNSIGGRNNTGEGGEDPDWYHELIDGYPVSSKIKQVASARFGVTTEYLVRAEELEIKMAQGSKPGEGGQLPSSKVTPFIARLRHTAPGVTLISPPPHHDIYSIEDIAQLIYDLRQVNPRARIGVKLVSCAGVGTIAAGVAKAHADYVLISGHDGGTGASPLQSIKHAGISWEFGLAEAQQVLLRNGLRQRVTVRVDGGFKTGRDIVIGAMLGAEEFGFGTAALVSLGCEMARQCHLNTCPAGIATQREDLRAKFTGQPQYVINYLTQVAEEVREFMARLGIARFDDLVGRADLLQAASDASVDLSPMLVAAPGIADPALAPRVTLHPSLAPHSLNDLLVEEAEQALRGDGSVLIQHPIHNADRAIGASLAGEIARRYGNAGLPGTSVTCAFHGTAGQSFGAFCLPGLRLILHGDANDYVGKSMTGGQIVIAPPPDAGFAAHRNTIIGNTVLYGATGGQLYAAGRAGERFAVRNSGALAVVEGVGAHGCEYMTGGMVVVLGETGPNFGAGMSAGVAYVLDTKGIFPMRCNTEMVELQRLDDPDEIEALREVIHWHRQKTHSWRAAQVLAEWSRMQRLFWRVSALHYPQTASDFVIAHSEAHDMSLART